MNRIPAHGTPAKRPVQELSQRGRVLFAAVFSVYERIFERYPAARRQGVAPARCQQLGNVPAPVDRHNGVADGVVVRVERHRERYLELLGGKSVDAVDDPAGRERYVPLADAEPAPRVADETDEGRRRLVVVERLADAHHDDVVDPLAAVVSRGDHLAEDLAGGHVPYPPAERRRAERAAHPAADLRRHADGVAVSVPHEDGLDQVAVGEPEQVFHRAVDRRHQLPGYLRQPVRGPFLKLRDELCRYVAHLSGRDPALHARVYLFSPVGGLAQRLEQLRQLSEAEREQVRRISRGRSRDCSVVHSADLLP